MTVVKNEHADAYVRRPKAEIQFSLIHGLDQGLIHERAKILVKSLLGDASDPLCLTRIDGDSIAREPGRISGEAYAISMFGGDRLIWIDAQSRELAGIIEPLMARPPPNCRFVVEAGNLKKGGHLRTAFETSTRAVSIECYSDEKRTLASLIDTEAREAGIKVTGEARDYLLTLLGSDRLTSRCEIAKLMLYAIESRLIERRDIEATIADAAPSNLSELIDQSMLGQMTEVERASNRFFGDGGDPGHLTTRLLAQLTLLHSHQLEADVGNYPEPGLQKQFVRLSLFERKALARQAERWSLSRLKKRLPALQKNSAQARGDAKFRRLIAIRALWTLASASQLDRE
jgi:DNA polymerase-3 subunit delta